MPLVKSEERPVFDAALIAKGYLLYARHRSWDEGRGGVVTRVSEDKITVQFHPGIGNVTNHFHILAKEAADGQWEIRCSKDMTDIVSVEMTSEDTEAGNGGD